VLPLNPSFDRTARVIGAQRHHVVLSKHIAILPLFMPHPPPQACGWPYSHVYLTFKSYIYVPTTRKKEPYIIQDRVLGSSLLLAIVAGRLLDN